MIANNPTHTRGHSIWHINHNTYFKIDKPKHARTAQSAALQWPKRRASSGLAAFVNMGHDKHSVAHLRHLVYEETETYAHSYAH